MSVKNFATAAFLAAALVLPGCAQDNNQTPTPQIDLSDAPEGGYHLVVPNGHQSYSIETPSLQNCVNTLQTATDVLTSAYGTCISKQQPTFGFTFYCYSKAGGTTYSNGMRCGVEKIIKNPEIQVDANGLSLKP